MTNDKNQNLNLGKMRIIGIIAALILIITGILFSMFLSRTGASIMADSSDESLFITKNIEGFNVKFGYQQDPQVMIFEREDVGIGIKIPFENITWEKVEDILEASSGDYIFRYSITKDGRGNSVGIKEDIILSKIPQQTNFEFPINLKNLRPQKIKDIWRFFDEKNREQFYIPKPFMIDAKGERSEEVEIEILDNKMNVIADKEWLNDSERIYPVIIDPSFMITILNIHSHPQAGDNWTVSFEIVGTADLKIIPVGQDTIDDLDFVSLTCDGKERSPQILEDDVVFYSDWSCDGTGKVIHLVNIEAPHILEFQFSDQVAHAYNSPGGGDISFQNMTLNNLRTEKYTEPWACGDDITDSRDSETYGTVEIGEQCWMSENLSFNQSSYGGDWCYSDDCATNEATYGRLYNWVAAMQGAESSSDNPSGVQGVCPTDWHLPSYAEGAELTTYLGGVSVAGGKMKEVGTIHWNSPNTDADNSSGFTALPSGYRNIDGVYYNIGNFTHIWYAQEEIEDPEGNAYNMQLWFNYAVVNIYNRHEKEYGHAVRCLRD